mgnify:CR=1 FL=1
MFCFLWWFDVLCLGNDADSFLRLHPLPLPHTWPRRPARWAAVLSHNAIVNQWISAVVSSSSLSVVRLIVLLNQWQQWQPKSRILKACSHACQIPDYCITSSLCPTAGIPGVSVKGARGPIGLRGFPGLPGAPGISGSKGMRGEIGAPGFGLIGPPGTYV